MIIALDTAAREISDSDGYLDSSGSNEALEFNPVYQEMKVEANKAGVEVSTLKIELAEYENKVEKLKSAIDIIPEVEANLTRLNRDYEITRSRYLDLVERRESAKLAQSAGQSTSDIKFRVIDPPVIPTRASGPPRVLFLLAVLVVSFGAGLAWSFARFIIEPTYLDLKQVSEKTGRPLLGTVSLYLSPGHLRKRRLQLLSFISSTAMLVVFIGGAILFHKQAVELVDNVATEIKQNIKG